VTINAALTLSDELRAIEHEHPGWHLFTSDSGDVWAVTTENHDGGSGTTLEAPSPQAMRREIAVQERIWGIQAPCWASAITTKAERRELADALARWCKSFYDAGEELAIKRRARADGVNPYALGHALMNCSAEMGDLRIDVTERAEVAAA
jgi:hypothetical protein